MFYSINMDSFGKRLKDIRLKLNLSQLQVAERSKINIDTLRKIENGYCIAKFETLLYLSEVYKSNLITEMSKYSSDLFLNTIYIQLDMAIVQENTVEMDALLDQIESSNIKSKLLCNNTIKQLKFMTQAIRLRYSNSIPLLHEARERIIQALLISHREFHIENFKEYTYSYIEIRLLIILASILGDIRECIISNDIASYVITTLDHSIYSSRLEDSLITKTLSLLSYNYHRLDNHRMAVDYANKGIEFCINKNCIETLPYLYFRKGIGEYLHGSIGFLLSLNHSINLLKATNKPNIAEQYIEILHTKYSIHLD